MALSASAASHYSAYSLTQPHSLTHTRTTPHEHRHFPRGRSAPNFTRPFSNFSSSSQGAANPLFRPKCTYLEFSREIGRFSCGAYSTAASGSFTALRNTAPLAPLAACRPARAYQRRKYATKRRPSSPPRSIQRKTKESAALVAEMALAPGPTRFSLCRQTHGARTFAITNLISR